MTCTHTSDWHKEMKPCFACGAEYTDEEADHISQVSTRAFSQEQLAFIANSESEQEDD